MKIWEPKPPGALWATPGLLRGSFNFILVFINIYWWSFYSRLHGVTYH